MSFPGNWSSLRTSGKCIILSVVAIVHYVVVNYLAPVNLNLYIFTPISVNTYVHALVLLKSTTSIIMPS